MTKNQTAQVIVDAFYKNKFCVFPCSICVCDCRVGTGIDVSKERCIEGVRQFLIQAEKERYSNGKTD